MSKGERISRFVESLETSAPKGDTGRMADHPYYRAYFQCWNEQRYYEAHDVLEQIWLKSAISAEDAQYFKGLIQAAGAFVHLQKQFEHPTHPKHGKRLGPPVRLFRLAEKNLAPVRRRGTTSMSRSFARCFRDIATQSMPLMERTHGAPTTRRK